MKLNDQPVDFLHMDLSVFERGAYDATFKQAVSNARLTSLGEALSCATDNCSEACARGAVRVIYSGLDHGPSSFKQVAEESGIMPDIRANVPRTAYMGVVSFWQGDTLVYLVPSDFT